MVIVIVIVIVIDAVAVAAAVVHGGAVLAEETIGAVIGILVRMKDAGHTERVLTMDIR